MLVREALYRDLRKAPKWGNLPGVARGDPYFAEHTMGNSELLLTRRTRLYN